MNVLAVRSYIYKNYILYFTFYIFFCEREIKICLFTFFCWKKIFYHYLWILRPVSHFIFFNNFTVIFCLHFLRLCFTKQNVNWFFLTLKFFFTKTYEKKKKFNTISCKVLCTVPENKKLVGILFIRAFYFHCFALLWHKKVEILDVLLSMSRGREDSAEILRLPRLMLVNS